MATHIQTYGKLLGFNTGNAGPAFLKPTTPRPSAEPPITIKSASSLLLGLSLSCLTGLGLAQALSLLTELGRLEAYIAAISSLILFASGLRVVPTFHQGVIVLLGYRIPKFVLGEGCHWLLPMIYRLKTVAVKIEVLDLHDLTVTTNGEPGELIEFADLELQLSIRWQVIDPSKALETEGDVLEKLLSQAVIEAVRTVAFKNGRSYSTIVRSCGKILTVDAAKIASQRLESLGIAVQDIFLVSVRLAEAAPGSTEIFTKPMKKMSPFILPSPEAWAAAVR